MYIRFMNEREKYIEEVGLFYEKYGLPKMAGRIRGYLFSSEKDDNSFQQLREALKASKGSISGNLSLLLTYEMIEKHMIVGDRKSYYKIAQNTLVNILEAKVKSVTEMRIILAKGLHLNSSKSNKDKLAEVLKYYEFLEKEIPLLKVKWEESKHKKAQNSEL